MELNREQIIKALECCLTLGGCNDCPYYEKPSCGVNARRDALSLIKELTEENERLRADNAKYEAENHAQFDKWLKLEEATKRHHSELFEEAKIVVKKETVRKMQERLKVEAYAIFDDDGAFDGYVIDYDDIDQIAKEMLEGGDVFQLSK